MLMENLELLSFKNISRDHYCTKTENLILGIMLWLHALMDIFEAIGFKKAILELHQVNLT